MTNQRSIRVAVVGGGLSGLTAAYYLHRLVPQAHIRLYEAGARIGGVVETRHRDGWLVEQGADCFSINPPDALRLCQDLGVADELIQPSASGRRAMISRGDSLAPVPEGFVLMRPTRIWPVMRSPLLSWHGKLRLAAERFVRPRRAAVGATLAEDESVASFARRRLGTEAHDRLVQPLVAGIYTADAERLSMQAAMPRFFAMEQRYGSLTGAPAGAAGSAADDPQTTLERHSSGARYGQFRTFPGGMEVLFQRIVAAIPEDTIRLNRAVRSLARTADGRWRILTKVTNDAASDVEGDAQRSSGTGDGDLVDGLVIALPASAAADLLEPLAVEAARRLEEIAYASSAVVLVGVRRSRVARLPNAFGFVVPAVDGRPILAASFADHKFSGRAPDDHSLIRVFIGGALRADLLERSDAELVQIALDELEELIGLEGPPAWTDVRRWDRAMPQYHVGHKQRVQRIEQEVGRLPGIEIAGNALHGVGIAPVVGTARRAAERLVRTLAPIDRHS